MEPSVLREAMIDRKKQRKRLKCKAGDDGHARSSAFTQYVLDQAQCL